MNKNAEIIQQFLDAGKNLTLLDSKKPVVKDWPNKRLDKEAVLNHGGNIGWVLDEDDLVVDVDPRNGGEESYTRLLKDLGIHEDDVLPTVFTASGGHHTYFKLPKTQKPRKLRATLAKYPGIDFLSKGKQCVIPGSETEKGRYEWVNYFCDEVLQDECPSQLLALLAHEPSTNTSSVEKVITVDDQLTQEIIDMLPHISSEDRDTWVLIGLALCNIFKGSDAGREIWHEWSKPASTYKDHYDIIKTWASFKPRAENPVSLGTIKKMAYEAGYQVDVTDEFDDVGDLDSPDETKKMLYQLIQVARYAQQTRVSWLIKDILPEAGLAMIYGDSGSGKTFFAMDMCFALARGVPWGGRDIKKPAKIAYVAAEGAMGISSRLQAYAVFNGIKLDDIPFYIVRDVPNLHGNDDKPLIDSIQKQGGANVVIIDTLAQVTPGANENSGEHMGAVIKRCQNLVSGLGCLVILIHHSGKDASRGSRGWSGIKGALDTEVRIEYKASSHSSIAIITKQKDGESGVKFQFRLESVCIGIDEDEKPLTSCVVQYSDALVSDNLPEISGKWQKLLQEAAESLDFLGDFSEEDLIEEAVICSGEDDVRKSSVHRALKTMISRGLFAVTSEGLLISQFHTSSQSA